MFNVSIFNSKFCSDLGEARLWVSVVNKAIDDLSHSNPIVAHDAYNFFMLDAAQDDRLDNLLSCLLGFDKNTASSLKLSIRKIILEKYKNDKKVSIL